MGVDDVVMPKARYLAPWHQRDLIDTIRGGGGEELRELEGKPAIYHCISRVVDRRFVLGKAEKEQFVSYMRLYEEFCQVRVLAFCVMSNHFHLLLEIPMPPEDRGESWSDEQLLSHLRGLYSGAKLREIEWKLAHLRSIGNHDGANQLRASFFSRMWDLSQFMKTLKQRFTRWFNRRHERKGTLWEERFKSTLVESGLAARTIAGYIDLNPVRAGLAQKAEEYRWCSFAEAVIGKKRSREGLQRVMFERERHATSDECAADMLLSWRKTARRYHQLLNADHQRGEIDRDTAISETSEITQGEILRHKLRHFTDGLVIGSQSFLEDVFAVTRGYFGSQRRSGARKIRDFPLKLFSMREL